MNSGQVPAAVRVKAYRLTVLKMIDNLHMMPLDDDVAGSQRRM
jgi:hypothetical protein